MSVRHHDKKQNPNIIDIITRIKIVILGQGYNLYSPSTHFGKIIFEVGMDLSSLNKQWIVKYCQLIVNETIFVPRGYIFTIHIWQWKLQHQRFFAPLNQNKKMLCTASE